MLFVCDPDYLLSPLTGLRERRSSTASPSSEPEWSEYRLLRSTPGRGDLDLDKDRDLDLDLDLERVGDLDRDIDLDGLERDGERESSLGLRFASSALAGGCRGAAPALPSRSPLSCSLPPLPVGSSCALRSRSSCLFQ